MYFMDSIFFKALLKYKLHNTKFTHFRSTLKQVLVNMNIYAAITTF